MEKSNSASGTSSTSSDGTVAPSIDGGYGNEGFINDDVIEDIELKLAELGHRRNSASVLTIPDLSKRPAKRPIRSTSSLVSTKLKEPAKKAEAKFSSVNYSPTHSLVYMDWLKSYGHNHLNYEWHRWFLTFLIGVLTGLAGAFLNQCLDALGRVKWTRSQDYAADEDHLLAWGWAFGIGCVYCLIASILVSFIYPPAVGGGTQDVIAYLNGVLVRGVFGLKNFFVKFTSNVFAVSSGMPCATQGPIITFGAIIGNGVGQFRSKTLNCTPNAFSRLRNAIDRRAFTTAGVAAGVAAAFNAPIGGLMFAMEDLSSFWSKSLSWHVFFASVLATAVAGLFQAAFNGFQFEGVFGLFTLSMTEPITPHVALIAVAIVLGLVGGVLGAVFTLCNTQVVVRARAKILSKVNNPFLYKILRVFECLIIVFIMSLYYTELPKAFECTNLASVNTTVVGAVADCFGLGSSHAYGNGTSPIKLIPFHCQNNDVNGTTGDYFYSEIATIVQNGGQAQVRLLWSRGTHYFFHWYTPLVLLAVWLPMTIWTIGSAVAGGIFVPVLITGGLYGRSLGVGITHLYHYITGIDIPTDNTWRWIDPGLIAVMGTGSMLGGVTRLALASTVIVVEMSQDINMVIPVMISVIVAKFTADDICKPLFKFQLEAKSLPYLDHEPRIALQDEIVNLELFKAKDVMASPVHTIRAVETLYSLSRLLTNTTHDGFPVIKRDIKSKLDVCYGLITRNELYAILCSDDVFQEQSENVVINPFVPYDQLSEDYIFDEEAKLERVKSYSKLDYYKSIYVNLDPFINISTTKVEEDFSLQRTYNLFRTLGLRHLVVVDIRNHPVGMITRKDLTPFNIVERLSELPKQAINTNNGLMKQLSVTNSVASEKDSVFLPPVAVRIPTISETVEGKREDKDNKPSSSDDRPSSGSSSSGSSSGSSSRGSNANSIEGLPMHYGDIDIKM